MGLCHAFQFLVKFAGLEEVNEGELSDHESTTAR
jgi:hypothetical protein